MGHTLRMTFLVLFIIASSVAHAQGCCPPGQHPVAGQGWNYCAPNPGYDAASAASTPSVQNKWLSLALDPAKGVLGAAVSTISQDEAENAAVKECRRQGDDACAVNITQANGCVAMVTGKAFFNTRGGATKSEAVQKSMDYCEANDGQCTV